MKIIEGIEAVRIVETALILTMRTLNLAVVPGSVGTDEFVAYAQRGTGILEKSGQIALGIGKAIGELKAVVGLNTFHGDTAALEPGNGFL